MDSIGRYRLEGRIGAGSFATVWKGHDDDLDVPVAVKVLAENWAHNDDVRNRFLAEARIMRRIHNPRLVQVYDVGTLDDGRPYFVMDYIDGGSMNDLRKAGIDPVRGLRLAVEACRAIEVLHENDIIHRDVTPGNLLLSSGPDGETRVLIADLGVAKSMIDSVGATMTAGTPAYMAPEQAAGVMPLDRRADIFSLTAVTYALLTGSPPFGTRSIADIMARDPDLAPEPIADRLGAPATLDGVMVAGLAADRNRRPPTALLLAEGLETIAQQMESARRPASPATPNPPPAEETVVTNPSVAWPASPEVSQPAAYPAVSPSPAPPVSHLTPQPPLTAASAPEQQPMFAGSLPPAYAPEPYQMENQPVENPYPVENAYPASVASAGPTPPRRRSSYYILLSLAALALFAISMFVTVLVLA
ncbi:MAG TPA: protein kinase [Propionibacteriaceae bacterium]|nr:protein kinase [Propionibacteriaceae bacterium]